MPQEACGIPRSRFGLTDLAAFGGALTARELFFDYWAPAVVGVYRTLSYGVASQWPYILWCSLPEG